MGVRKLAKFVVYISGCLRNTSSHIQDLVRSGCDEQVEGMRD